MKLQKYKRDSEVSYAMGATLVAELLKLRPEAIRRVFLRPTEEQGDDLKKIITEIKERKIEIIEGAKAFNILGAKDSCLLMAEFSKNSIRPKDYDKHRLERTIVLVNPSDAGNLGTIMRSAAAFGFYHLVIVQPAVDPYNPKVIRASMGAVFYLIVDVVEKYEDAPENSFAFMLRRNAQHLEETELEYLEKPLTLIFGNEAAGLPSDFCEKTGAKPIFIHQSKDVDSLNLGVAASIAMHYATFRARR